jgi:hypothetical protein
MLDADGLHTYQWAVWNCYTDWLPAIMSIILRGLLYCGGTHTTLTLVQCVAGCLGVYHLALAAIMFCHGERVADGPARLGAFVVLLVLLLPLSPLMYYLAHFGKDTWAAICVVGVGAFALRLRLHASERGLLRAFCHGFGLVFCITLFLMVRHNAIVVMPAFALLGAAVARPWGKARALMFAAVVVGTYPLANMAMTRVFSIKATHPEDQVMANELVGLCILDERLINDLPLTRSHLIAANYRRNYQWGYVDPMFETWPLGPLVTPGFTHGNHDELAREYWRAARRHPLQLADVKLRGFLAVLGESKPFWHHMIIDPNPWGLRFNHTFEGVRTCLLAVDSWIYQTRYLRWVCVRHTGWLLLTMAATCWLGWRGIVRGDGRAYVAFVLLLVPLGYYASYVLASASRHYRYMYPSTLLVQVLLLSLTAGWAARRLSP